MLTNNNCVVVYDQYIVYTLNGDDVINCGMDRSMRMRRKIFATETFFAVVIRMCGRCIPLAL